MEDDGGTIPSDAIPCRQYTLVHFKQKNETLEECALMYPEGVLLTGWSVLDMVRSVQGWSLTMVLVWRTVVDRCESWY